MDLGRIRLGLGSKRPQRLEPACDVFKGYALQFGASLQSLYEKRQRRFYGFAALRAPVEMPSLPIILANSRFAYLKRRFRQYLIN